MLARRDRTMGLGSIHDITLAEARDAARECRRLVRQGLDPIEHQRQQRAGLAAATANVMTFDTAAAKYITAHRAGWRNPKHAQQWENTLATYCSPVFGSMSVADIQTAHIMRALEPHWAGKTETMKRLRGRIEAVLAWATVQGYRTGDNPAQWRNHLDMLLAAPNKVATKSHFASLPYAELRAFMQALRKQEGIAAQALQFAILTAARSGEVRGMAWDEVDLQAGTWTVPAERMKGHREHRVPLSKQALVLLKAQAKHGGTDIVFPTARGKGAALSDMSLTAVLRRMAVPVTVHGFRSTFSTWTAEQTNYPSEVRESCLAHISADKVSAAYMRSDFMAKRASLMQAWATFIDRPALPAKVTSIASKRKVAGAK